jgi:hypothetical protein
VATTCIDVSVFEHEPIQADEAHRSGDMAGVAAGLRTALGRWQGTALNGLPGLAWSSATPAMPVIVYQFVIAYQGDI